jgi:hypothetical protein
MIQTTSTKCQYTLPAWSGVAHFGEKSCALLMRI